MVECPTNFDEESISFYLTAAAYGHRKTLVEMPQDVPGIHINVADHDGWTPLMAAAEEGDADAVGLVLRLGGDIRATTEKGFTALHVAAYHGRASAVKTLIEAGAQVDGGSWFDALHGGDEEAIQFIEAQLEIVQDWFDEIDEIDDQGILAKTAVKSGYEEVRDAAVRRVTDLSLLEQIAETAPSADVREAAVDRWVSLSS